MTRVISRTAGLLGLGLLAAAVAFHSARGEPPAAAPRPRVDEMSPLGVRRGFTCELTIRGSALSGNPRLVAPFRFIVAAPPPNGSDASTFTIRLTVAPDTALGIYPVRVLTDEGFSDPFPLAVGQLPQIQEKEDNDKAAQRVALPAVIEGLLPEGDYDNFRFQGKKGQRIVSYNECADLGSGFEPCPVGVVSLDRKYQSDLSHWELPKDDDYLFFVRRDSFRPIKSGRPVYRLTIGELPMAAEVYPPGGRRGETIRVELRGGTLDGVKVIPVTLEPAPGEAIVRLRATTSIPGPDGRPLDVEALPPLVVSDLPELLEPIAPDAPPVRAVAPVVFNGRIDPPGDEDRFTLAVTAGERLRAEVTAWELGSVLYPVLQVLDARGKELASVHRTTVPARAGLPEYESTDPSAEFTVPQGQNEVTLIVLDYYSDPRSFVWDRGRVVKPPARGGVGFAYRLTVVPVEPGFEVALNDAQVSVPRGGAAAVGVSVTRKGYSGPIALRVANAPPGLNVRPGAIAERQTVGAFTLAAAADSTFGPVVLDVIGEGRGPGPPIVTRASKTILFGEPTTMPFRVTTDVIDGKPAYSNFPANLRTRIRTQTGLLTATTKAAPLILDAPTGPIRVIQGRGTTFQVTATRPNGARGPLTLSPLPLPPGLSVPDVRLGETATSATVTVNTTSKHPAGIMTIVLTARGRIAGIERCLTVPAVTLQIVPPGR